MEYNGKYTAAPSIIIRNEDILVCPACGGKLSISADTYRISCSRCNRYFKCEKGIPLLFWPNQWGGSKTDVTDKIKRFYEETPFPNYNDFDSIQSLREKAEKMFFFRNLHDQVPRDGMILEVGCGTGQLGNFLATERSRTVFSTDICLNSLRLGHDFKEKNKIDNIIFCQMNLFKPVFKPNSFDLIICSGVLHHTSDPFLGFQSISKLVKRGGFIIIGLYNAYGRIFTKIRGLILKSPAGRFKFLDSYLRNNLRTKNSSDIKKHTWFMDQYKNPHESTHTFGEVLKWFDLTGFEFINSIPKSTSLKPSSSGEKLFNVNMRGSRFSRCLVQLGMVFNKSREGGFFIMIARKK